MTMPNDHEHAVCGEVRDNAALVAHIRRLTEQSPVESDPSLTTVDYNDLSLFADTIAALTAEVERVRAETIEAAAKVAERDAAWTTFAGRGLEQWEDGADGARDYRLGIRVGGIIAAHIRSLAGEVAGPA